MNKSPSFKILINYDFDENEFLVFVTGIPDLYGRGETESSAILNFLTQYEENYAGFKCFSKEWVQQQISTHTLRNL